jgi:hypothetical protein
MARTTVGFILPGDAELAMSAAGTPYVGDDPDGFIGRDEIVRYIEDYAGFFDPPVIAGVAVIRLRRDRKGRYRWIAGTPTSTYPGRRVGRSRTVA